MYNPETISICVTPLCNAINTLLEKAEQTKDSADAQRFTQAVLNLSHAKEILTISK
jgi:hypothetical protein